MFLAGVVLLVVATPSLVAHGLGDAVRSVSWRFPLVAAIVLALAIGLAHVASVAFRSRSRWLALDLAAALAVFLLAASSLRRLEAASALVTGQFLGTMAALATIPALWIASAVQVTRGRTDLQRGHRAQSIALWSMLGTLALAMTGFSSWYVAADVADLARVWARPAPRGSWLALAGTPPGKSEIMARFLYDLESHASIRLANGWQTVTHFSGDGTRAVWLQRTTGDGPIEVAYVDLAKADRSPRTSTISFPSTKRILTDLSPSGRRLATLQGTSFGVHDVETGAIVAAFTLETEPAWGKAEVGFVDDGRVRVLVEGATLVAHEIDLTTRHRSSWTVPGTRGWGIRWDRRHDRMLIPSNEPGEVLLVEGGSGETLARLPVVRAGSGSHCGFLGDGRVAGIGSKEGGGVQLDVYSERGERQTSFELDPLRGNDWYWIGPQPSAGTLLVGKYRARNPDAVGGDPDQLILLSLSTGARREVQGQDERIGGFYWGAQSYPVEPGTLASRLLQGNQTAWLLDPETVTVRKVMGQEK
ncbi:MAG TPA: hypothetical protein VFG76_07540 [Candidatus Polarisedimenticolia bacterium]|nr:hypothetical protein [Candidatus Polarisedimenticolia bacterium]